MYRGPSTPYQMTEDEVREACAAWFAQRFGGAADPGMVRVSIGTKRVPEGMGFYSDEPFISVVVSPGKGAG